MGFFRFEIDEVARLTGAGYATMHQASARRFAFPDGAVWRAKSQQQGGKPGGSKTVRGTHKTGEALANGAQPAAKKRKA